MPTLQPDQIRQRLSQLSGWEFKDNAITKQYKFKEFLGGIRFVNTIAQIAESMDHHPDILINYTRIRFTCTTHSEGGVTDKDFKLAQEIEKSHAQSQHG